jgi:hypothetical protein
VKISSEHFESVGQLRGAVGPATPLTALGNHTTICDPARAETRVYGSKGSEPPNIGRSLFSVLLCQFSFPLTTDCRFLKCMKANHVMR